MSRKRNQNDYNRDEDYSYDYDYNNEPISYRKVKQKRRENNIPSVLGALIFGLIFVYLLVNMYIYMNKDKVAIYEVQAEELNFDTSFDAVCIRQEKILTAANSGYINYYISQGNKVAKNNVIYSIDTSENNVYSRMNEDYESIIYNSDQIAQIKAVIVSAMRDYDGSDLTWAGKFSDELSDKIYEIANSNLLDYAVVLQQTSSSNSDFHQVKVPESGIVSYKTDELCGITADDVNPVMFKSIKSYETINLKETGLVAKGEDVCRLCPVEDWSVVAQVSEDFYINNVDRDSATIYINGSTTPMTGELRLFTRNMKENDKKGDGKDIKYYYAEISLHDRMSQYIDSRFVKVEFEYPSESGLKIPLTAVTSKEFYIVPLSMFVIDKDYKGPVLEQELYDGETGETTIVPVYLSKYIKDDYYAYIDKSVVNEGDYFVNTETDERFRVGSVNTLDGVYCVNKGYYVFTWIEKIKSNSEYVIIRKNSNSKDAIKLYDHIALNSSDAVEGKIIN